MNPRRSKTTKFKLVLTAYKRKEGRSIELTVKAGNVKEAMLTAMEKLEKKGFNRIRLEKAKIGRKVLYENKEKS